MDRMIAWEIVMNQVKDTGLRRHMLAVEAAMRRYAERLNENADQWGAAGLLHDFDWEMHPTLEDHPRLGADILREKNVPESIITAILSHNTAGTGIERTRSIDFALLACDEITGLIIATALVRPSKDIRDVELKSIKKKWKAPAFAAGVNRDEVISATQDFSEKCFAGQLDLWTHVENVLSAMKDVAGLLELDGSSSA